MIDVASPSASQRHSFTLSVARQRRAGSPDDASRPHREHNCSEKFDRNADHERLFATLHSLKSFSTASTADRAIRPRPPAPLKSP
jgi:hypothetical protein